MATAVKKAPAKRAPAKRAPAKAKTEGKMVVAGMAMQDPLALMYPDSDVPDSDVPDAAVGVSDPPPNGTIKRKGRPPAKMTVEEFAELVDVTPATIRRWAKLGFPGVTEGVSVKNRPIVLFPAATVKQFAGAVNKANGIFRVVGRA